MRVFLPATPATLAAAASGTFTPAVGFSAGPEIVAVLDDAEVADEYARDAAATASVIELRSPRRIVIAADVPPALVTPAPDLHPAAVRLGGPVALGDIACIFADEEVAEADARAAATGDAEALERLEFRFLLWYDAGEITQLATELGAPAS